MPILALAAMAGSATGLTVVLAVMRGLEVLNTVVNGFEQVAYGLTPLW